MCEEMPREDVLGISFDESWDCMCFCGSEASTVECMWGRGEVRVSRVLRKGSVKKCDRRELI